MGGIHVWDRSNEWLKQITSVLKERHFVKGF